MGIEKLWQFMYLEGTVKSFINKTLGASTIGCQACLNRALCSSGAPKAFQLLLDHLSQWFSCFSQQVSNINGVLFEALPHPVNIDLDDLSGQVYLSNSTIDCCLHVGKRNSGSAMQHQRYLNFFSYFPQTLEI